MKPSIKIMLAILLSLSTVAAIIIWDLYIKDQIDSVEVLVVAPGVSMESKQKILGNEFIIEKRAKSSLIEEVLLPEDMTTIIGYDTAVPLIANQMVSLKHIDFDKIIPDPKNGEAIRPIPDEWIYMKPGSLRRKDRIDIYMLDRNFLDIVSGKEPSKPALVTSTPTEIVTIPQENNENEIESINISQISPILNRIPVVYAKDGSNNEVVDTTSDVQSDGTRLNASGRINELELNMNEEDFNLLVSYINQGYKMYIIYH